MNNYNNNNSHSHVSSNSNSNSHNNGSKSGHRRISSVLLPPQQKEQLATNMTSSCRIHSEINFRQLAENRLVNELYGFSKRKQRKQEQQQQQQQQQQQKQRDSPKEQRQSPRTERSMLTARGTSSYNAGNSAFDEHTPRTRMGLHPVLEEKLDFVINEGVLDAVLPFICPVPLPMPYTARSNKSKHIKESKSIVAPSIPPPPPFVPIITDNASDSDKAPPPNSKELPSTCPKSAMSVARRKSISNAKPIITASNKE